MAHLPTFVVAGGSRSGTTWLHHLLEVHPEIYMAQPARPEPKFFLREPEPGRDLDWYAEKWFSDVGDAKAIGEKSTSYAETPGVAERIRRLMPDLKVLVILRHPLERALSNYFFSRQNGLETLELNEAFATEEQRVATEKFDQVSVHPFAYAGRSRYADNLAQFLEHFPREQLGIFLHEDLRERSDETLTELYDFVGVDPSFRPGDISRRHNQSPKPEVWLERATALQMRDRVASANRELEKILGRDLSHWDELPPSIEAIVRD